jgi:NADH dehydrogenase FAD-containing subunit
VARAVRSITPRQVVLGRVRRLPTISVLDVGSEVASTCSWRGAPRAGGSCLQLERARQSSRRWRSGEACASRWWAAARSGVEGGAIQQLAVRRRGAVAVALLAEADRLLPGIRPATGRRINHELERRGVRCATGTRVTAIEADRARTASGGEHAFDLLVLATGLVPVPLLRRLAVTDGAAPVDATLRSVADPTVFGAGDCIAFAGRALPHIGVHAVKQAPVLLHNLLAALAGGPPRRYRPQRRALLILNLGDGTGLATWGGLAWRGRAAFWVKDRIDRRWLERARLASSSGT